MNAFAENTPKKPGSIPLADRVLQETRGEFKWILNFYQTKHGSLFVAKFEIVKTQNEIETIHRSAPKRQKTQK